ncbi:protein-L-isoaspartate O-methyltransferase [Rhizobium sp. BK529]|uniref:class I SAM-dependent methyltransferase n=1 Tax=Rhizobium sp. BK418 TaxID=2512120 RepID=UPI0017F2615C|nr:MULTISPECIES: methyltransferase domain-containing protein [unclassified Rhizobium]MBB3594400.1 protein-L-isoaspartate O-methyltransferase [Rhizobium sp. BK529]
MEVINRRTWSSPLSRRDYRNSSGFINEGERMVLGIGLANAKGGRVLDIGVGGGRTAALLAGEAGDYVGIDYTPEMVTLARSNHPGLRFENMDARDLSAFAKAPSISSSSAIMVSTPSIPMAANRSCGKSRVF